MSANSRLLSVLSPFRFVRVRSSLFVAICIATGFRASPAVAQSTEAAAARADVDRLLLEAEAPLPGVTRGEALRVESDRHEKAARAIETFLKRFPDDPSADRFTIARLRAIYWTVTARGHELDPIEEELNRIDVEKARPAVRVAVSYWMSRLARDKQIRERVDRGEQTPVLGPAARLEEFDGMPQRVEDEHARRHPDTPGAAAVFRNRAVQALERFDVEQAAQWIGLLAKHHPTDAMLTSLQGDLRLRENLGQLWAPPLSTFEKKPVDWTSHRGKVTLVVFWSPRFRPSVTLLRRTSAVVTAHPDEASIIAIGIDDDPATARSMAAELGFSGPFVHDGLGWRSPIAREYGIRVLPTVLFLDRDGKLADIEQLGRRQLSAEVVARFERMIGATSTSQPVETQPTEMDDGIPLGD